jgi:sec-independent protein translocase protein TatC
VRRLRIEQELLSRQPGSEEIMRQFDELDTMLMMDEVANFQMMTLAGCGLAFELPVVLSILGWMGILSSRGLLKFNKYAIVLAFVVGAVLTPSTDPFTQTLLAVPIFVLYNLSILVVWLIERARRKRDAALAT